MIPPRLRDLELDPLADLALPLLLILSTTLVIVALHAALGPYLLPDPAGLPLVALALGLEAYCFNTAFVVRHYDSALAMRLLEGAVALAVCWWVASTFHVGSLFEDAVDRVASPVPLFWTIVLFASWALGMMAAFQLVPLHPAQLKDAQGQDRKKHNQHGEAFESIRNRVLGELLAAALVTGVSGWATGEYRGVWGWHLPAVWLLVQAGVALTALAVANQLRQRVTWAQEGMAPPPALFARWLPAAGALALVPLLLALVLPVGPQLHLRSGGGPVAPPPAPPPPPARAVEPSMYAGMAKLLAQMQDLPPLVPPWIWTALVALLWAAVAVLALFLLKLALEQLRQRATREELRGFGRLLLMLLEWYAALWQALRHSAGRAAGRALKGAAEVVGGALGEAGAIGRYLPHRNRAPADPRSAVRYFFARLQAEAGRRRLGRAPGMTAGEFARRLAAAAPERSQEVAGLVELYNQARYSEEPVAAEAAGFARRAWVAIARALRR